MYFKEYHVPVENVSLKLQPTSRTAITWTIRVNMICKMYQTETFGYLVNPMRKDTINRIIIETFPNIRGLLSEKL